jgi:hypothetical protein
MLDDGKAVRGVIISVGGFLGIGDRKIAVEPQSLFVMEQNDGTISVTLNTNKEELQKAPQVTDADLDRAGATAGSGSPSRAPVLASDQTSVDGKCCESSKEALAMPPFFVSGSKNKESRSA